MLVQIESKNKVKDTDNLDCSIPIAHSAVAFLRKRSVLRLFSWNLLMHSFYLVAAFIAIHVVKKWMGCKRKEIFSCKKETKEPQKMYRITYFYKQVDLWKKSKNGIVNPWQKTLHVCRPPPKKKEERKKVNLWFGNSAVKMNRGEKEKKREREREKLHVLVSYFWCILILIIWNYV